MSEIEKIADRLEAALKRAGYYGDCFFRGKGETCPQCDEFDAILRDLRGIKVVLPAEIVDELHKPILGGLVVGRQAEWFYASIHGIGGTEAQADSPTAAISALAEKITKENG